MPSSPNDGPRGHLDHAGSTAQHRRPWFAIAAVILLGAGALIFDAVTPQTIEVGIFYVGMILVGFWFSRPRDIFVLAILATLLMFLGYYITIPDITPRWMILLNRFLDIGTVWIAALFVWRTRVLEDQLDIQIGITEALSFEKNHRIGNQLQLVASFLRLQARRSSSDETRDALEIAGSRVMTLGRIQRMLSHSTSHMIDSNDFIQRLVEEVRSALVDPNKVTIKVQADSAALAPTTATTLGALLLESINNALKHAFPDGMTGMLSVRFTISDKQYIIELEDDGIGIEHAQSDVGFGIQNLTDIIHLMKGSVTHHPAGQSKARPGTVWRLAIPT